MALMLALNHDCRLAVRNMACRPALPETLPQLAHRGCLQTNAQHSPKAISLGRVSSSAEQVGWVVVVVSLPSRPSESMLAGLLVESKHLKLVEAALSRACPLLHQAALVFFLSAASSARLSPPLAVEVWNDQPPLHVLNRDGAVTYNGN